MSNARDYQRFSSYPGKQNCTLKLHMVREKAAVEFLDFTCKIVCLEIWGIIAKQLLVISLSFDFALKGSTKTSNLCNRLLLFL